MRLLALGLVLLIALPTASAQSTPMPTAAPVSTLPAVDAAEAQRAMLYDGAARVMGFAFAAGQGLPSHSVDVEAFLLVSEGTARVRVGDAVHELAAGEGVVLPADIPHTVDAITDVRAVLVRPAAAETGLSGGTGEGGTGQHGDGAHDADGRHGNH